MNDRKEYIEFRNNLIKEGAIESKYFDVFMFILSMVSFVTISKIFIIPALIVIVSNGLSVLSYEERIEQIDNNYESGDWLAGEETTRAKIINTCLDYYNVVVIGLFIIAIVIV